MVVLSRQQLFTENTITVVLPVMKQFNLANLGRLDRLWRPCHIVGGLAVP
jgi:formate/nitrite transporter FocA (FNT family)